MNDEMRLFSSTGTLSDSKLERCERSQFDRTSFESQALCRRRRGRSDSQTFSGIFGCFRLDDLACYFLHTVANISILDILARHNTVLTC